MPPSHPRPTPPRPELVRQPSAAFGWLDAHLLHEGWLARLGPAAAAVLLLLALAGDRHGASFFGRRRMAEALGMSISEVNAALARLLELRLVAHRPWQTGNPDGVWQLLPVPRRESPREPPPREARRDGADVPVHIAAILAQLGIATDRRNLADQDRR